MICIGFRSREVDVARSDIEDVMGEIVHETSQAVLFHTGIKEQAVWLPKSQIEIHVDDPAPGLVTISAPEWLLIDKGLV